MSDNDRIAAYYLDRLGREGRAHEVLGWESVEAQTARFAVLLNALEERHRTLLDVGAGLGDLFRFLKEKGRDMKYVGVDILPEMVAKARTLNPEGSFYCVDAIQNSDWDGSYDVVFASGIFNLRQEDNMSMVARAAGRFSKLSSGLCVCNFLSDSSPDKEPAYYYYSKDEVRATYARSFRSTDVVTGYLPNDFTIVART